MLELEDSKTNNSEVKRLTGILSAIEKEMKSTKERLSETENQLSQEQALTSSLSKRTEVACSLCCILAISYIDHSCYIEFIATCLL